MIVAPSYPAPLRRQTGRTNFDQGTGAERARATLAAKRAKRTKRWVWIGGSAAIALVLAGLALLVFLSGPSPAKTPQEALDRWIAANNGLETDEYIVLLYVEGEKLTATERERFREIEGELMGWGSDMQLLLKEMVEIRRKQRGEPVDSFDFETKIVGAKLTTVEGNRALAKITTKTTISLGGKPEVNVQEREYELRFQDGGWRVNPAPT